jgi:nucleoside-diphosphate-sugar epimerase
VAATSGRRRVLVTGATGLVGSEMIDLLSGRIEADVVGVSRRPSEHARVIKWDMGRERAPEALNRSFDVVINTAADTRWTMTPEEALEANVASVEALSEVVTSHTKVVHVSTAYAVGLRGNTTSRDLDDYRNTYEWSKAAAERLVCDLCPSATIVRPPLIIGRREDGRAQRFSGMYTVVRGITTSLVPAIVARDDGYFDVVPVDDVAEAILDAINGAWDHGSTVTIGRGRAAPRVGVAVDLILDELNSWRAQRGVPRFDRPRLVTSEQWNRFFFPFAQEHLSETQLRILELLMNFEPYLRLTTPLDVNHVVDDVTSSIRASVRFWAESYPRVASLAPRPWT